MPSLFKRSLLPKLRSFPLTADAVTILSGAAEFRRCLLEKIASATRRIYIVALYLQQDEAGQEILDALHAAKAGASGTGRRGGGRLVARPARVDRCRQAAGQLAPGIRK